MADQPALPCPSWCTQDHSARFVSHTRVTEVGPDVNVHLTQSPAPDAGPDIYVGWHGEGHEWASVLLPLDEGRALAELLARLGYEDIAAAIRELAALAKENRHG
jgi:hypothetical protein